MSDLDSMNREIKKRQLRRQIVPSPAPQEEDSEEIVRKARKRVKLKRLRIFLIIGGRRATYNVSCIFWIWV